MSLFPLRHIEIYTIAFITASVLYLVAAWWTLRRGGARRDLHKRGIPTRDTPREDNLRGDTVPEVNPRTDTSRADILRGGNSRNALFLLLSAAALLRLLLLPLDPVGSDDLYRYIWDGKVQSKGINPYRYAPGDPELLPLHSARLPAAVNHPHMKSVYLPLTQWVFALCYQVSGEQVWAFKGVLILAEAALVWMLWIAAGGTGSRRTLILLYALSPLAILQFALDGHIDALGLPLLVGGLILYVRGKQVPGLILLGLSMSVKPVALVLLPVLFFSEKSAAARLRILLVPFIPVAAQFLPYMFTANPLDSLFTFARDWTFNGPVFEAVNAVVQHNQHARIVCAVLLLAAVGAVSFSRISLLEKCYLAVLLLLLCSPVVHPWYVAWLTALLPLVPRWSGIVLTAVVSLTALTVLEYQMTGVWEQPAWVLVVEYLPVAGALLWEGLWGVRVAR